MNTDIIDTQRLRLRRPTMFDADAIFTSFANNPEVTRYMAWPTHRSIADTQAFLEFATEDWQRHSTGTLLVECDGKIIGSTGIHLRSADRNEGAETGYVFAKQAWGRGYATEVLQAMVVLAANKGVKQLTAGCHPDNVASQRVLVKCGFSSEAGRVSRHRFPNTLPEWVIMPIYQRLIE